MSKYLSIDLEATGLEEDAKIIEFAAVCIDAQSKIIHTELQVHCYVKCPSYQELLPNLNPWVAKNNKEIINKAASQGITIDQFRETLEGFLKDELVKEFFDNQRPTLFGKSLSAIDIPFLSRDLGWDWMNEHFHHRNLDLSCFCKGLIDMKLLSPGMDSGEKLMKELGMGEVCHTALEDAVNTAKMYFKLLNQLPCGE